MGKLAISVVLRHACSALCGHYGVVTQQARKSNMSRQGVMYHGQRFLKELEEGDNHRTIIQEQRNEIQELRQRLTEAVVIDKEMLRHFVIQGHAIGISLRALKELLNSILPDERIPGHATMGRWTKKAAERAREILKPMDAQIAPLVRSVCADEIFFGG